MTGAREAIPRYRPFEGMSIFRHGFRPFFLGAGVAALILVPLWVIRLQGVLELPTAFGPVQWHAHELIFGFGVATISGFLLTAIPNWTGRMPLQGWPLAGLFGLWLVGRIAVSTSGWIGAEAGAVADLAYLAIFIFVVLREIISGGNWRNLPMPGALSGLLAANVLMHLEAMAVADTGVLGRQLGIAVIIALIGLIGGRIVPSFTRNWMNKRDLRPLPAAAGPVDAIAMAALVAALAAWLTAPDHPASGVVLIFAALATLVRLLRWSGHKTGQEPLLWSLHLGMIWGVFGLGLLGAAVWVDTIPASAGIHALTTGAIGTMTLAVMTRATLGHSGRELTASPATTVIYILISVAAAARVAASVFPEIAEVALYAAGAGWTGAFAIFVIVYGRILVSR